MFVGSTQQAAAAAVSAAFTGGTARSFHLGRGYGTVPPEEEIMHRGLDQKQNQQLDVLVCTCARVYMGR